MLLARVWNGELGTQETRTVSLDVYDLFMVTYRSPRENQGIVSNNASSQQKERIEVGEEQAA